MNVMIWLLAGAAAGWVTCSLLDLNAARYLVVSAIIGIVGVTFGGDALAPAMGGDDKASVLSPFAVLVASVCAIGCLKIARMVNRASSSRQSDARAAYESP